MSGNQISIRCRNYASTNFLTGSFAADKTKSGKRNELAFQITPYKFLDFIVAIER
jgi:hypothetical protein